MEDEGHSRDKEPSTCRNAGINGLYLDSEILKVSHNDHEEVSGIRVAARWKGINSNHLYQHHWYLRNTYIYIRHLIQNSWQPWGIWGFPGGSAVRMCPPVQETRVQPPGRENPLEKEIATHPSILLAWEILWTKEPGGLQAMGSQSN